MSRTWREASSRGAEPGAGAKQEKAGKSTLTEGIQWRAQEAVTGGTDAKLVAATNGSEILPRTPPARRELPSGAAAELPS